jgi:hypothetical protein
LQLSPISSTSKAQHRVARAVQAVVEQQVLGQPPQPRADAVVAPVAFALQQARTFELLEHAVQRGLGQAGFFDQALQRIAQVFRGHDFEQREQPHGGCVTRRFGGLWREPFDDLHGARS